MNLDFTVLIYYLPLFIQGLFVTIGYAIASVIFGLLIGTPLALLRLSNHPFLKGPASIYVEVIRGTPLLLQLFLVAYGLPMVFPQANIPDIIAGLVALSMNSSAYVAEIIRAGIQAVPKGQFEASRSLGLSYRQTMQKVIIPQAIKNVLPAIGNEFIAVVKESSIVSIIGIMDLMYITSIVKAQTFRIFEALLLAALLYFSVTYSFSKVLQHIERSWKHA